MEDIKKIQEFFSKPLNEEKEPLDIIDLAKVVKAVQQTGHPVTVLLVPKFNEIEVLTGMNAPDDMLRDLSNAVDSLGYGRNDIIIAGDSSNLSRREYSDIRRVNGGAKDYFEESVNEASRARVSMPRFVKDKNNPNFLNVYIDYDLGPGGASIAFGKETMTGQIRRESAAEAMRLASDVARDLEVEYDLEDIDIQDLENGKVRIFAVSDDFIDMNPNMLGEIKESLNPEVSNAVSRFIKAMAKRYDYSEQDAVFAIMAALKQRDFDGVNEATEEEENDFHKKLDKLVHKTFGHSSDEKKKMNEASKGALNYFNDLKYYYQKSFRYLDVEEREEYKQLAKDFFSNLQIDDKVRPVGLEESSSSEERRIAKRAIKSIAKYRGVSEDEARNDLIRAAKELGSLEENMSLDDQAKAYYLAKVKRGEIDTLPENPKAAFLAQMTKDQMDHDKETLRRERGLEEKAAYIAETIKLGMMVNEELCEKGKRYIKARQAAGEKSSAYLSGRAVRVCKGQIEWPKKGKKKK
jgi:hypothetical protein